jgi:hypothetical protein
MKSGKANGPYRTRFFLDLRSAYETESRLPPQFLDHLEYVFDTDSPDDVSLEGLERIQTPLDAWRDRCRGELQSEIAKLPRSHPVKCPISLFGTMHYGRLEVAHTRTLAWLLNPKGEHEFGDALLKALVRFSQGPQALKPFRVEKVSAEWYYWNSQDEDAGRTDIWIEGFWEDTAYGKPWLLVVEAKIDSSEADHQLDRYDKEIEANYSDYEVHRVFLTPEGRKPEGGLAEWKKLSFSQLVVGLWSNAGSLAAKPGYHFLQYYLAGVLKDVLHLPIGRYNGKQNQYKLREFLKSNSPSM